MSSTYVLSVGNIIFLANYPDVIYVNEYIQIFDENDL